MRLHGFCLLFLVFILCATAKADSQSRGVVALAMMHPDYPCTKALSALESAKSPAIAVLHGTFGTDLTCVGRFLKKFRNRPHTLVLYAENNTARRNRKWYSGEWLPGVTVSELNKRLERGDSATLRSYRRRVSLLLRRVLPLTRANTRLILVPSLEDNFSSRAWGRIYTETRRLYSGPIVRNPVDDLARDIRGADGIERHTDQRAKCLKDKICVVSNDGVEVRAGELRAFFKKNRHATVVMAWDARSQGRRVLERTKFSFTPPRERRFVFEAQYLESLRKALSDE